LSFRRGLFGSLGSLCRRDSRVRRTNRQKRSNSYAQRKIHFHGTPLVPSTIFIGIKTAVSQKGYCLVATAACSGACRPSTPEKCPSPHLRKFAIVSVRKLAFRAGS